MRAVGLYPVSYTHLDVYKRQPLDMCYDYDSMRMVLEVAGSRPH